MKSGSCRIWVARVFAMAVAMMTLVGLFNLLVDPYDIYRLVRMPGVNANKGMAIRQERLVKPLQVRFYKPRGLVLGSSRAAVGIDPQHPGWDPSAAPVFNFALTSATVEELAGRLEQAVALTTQRQVVVGLDFFMFNVYAGNPMAGAGEEGSPPWPVETLLTGAALTDSFRTLRKQDPVDRPGVLANGQISRTFNLRRVAKYGHHQGFQDYQRIFFEGSLFPMPEKEYALADQASGRSSIDAFRRLLETARRADIDLRLFISPVHVRLLEVYAQANLWPVYEQWKRQMVATLDEHNSRHLSQRPFPLWDFSGVNSITTEPVPPAGDRQSAMTWYWEASHFKAENGDLVLDRIFDCRRAGISVPDDFGVLLTPSTIEPHLAATRSALESWRRQHPQDVAEVRASGLESSWRKAKYRM